jgi:phosphoribosylformylglycinamidine cyclo-ligase
MTEKNREGGGMTYDGSGVDYGGMDPFKRMAQLAGRETAGGLGRFGFSEVEWSRGESCYLIDIGDACLGHVEEGLGTKNLIAEAVYVKTGKSHYAEIGQDAVAMIVNDLITLGALPVSVAMHLAIANASWFENETRCRDLVRGWKEACLHAGCVWGCGETPTLRDIVAPNTFVLAGSAIGLVKPKSRLLWPGKIRPGDAIIIVEATGIHANGATMTRDLAAKLPNGYLTIVPPSGRPFGETLLDPTPIYVPVIEELFKARVPLHYAVNITGHGWRKFMRAPQPFTYVIDRLPRQLPIFDFIQERGPVSTDEAYRTFNMGAGFAIYLPASQVEKALAVLASAVPENRAYLAGHIEKGERKVVIVPKGLEYGEETLGVR